MRVEELSRLGLELLDRQLVDREGVLCGNVDDLRFEIQGDDAVLTAILTGPGAWPDRLPRPLRRLARAVLFDTCVAIPLSDVEAVDGAVRLKRRARELGLGLGEERAARWLMLLPRSREGENR